MKGGAHPTPFAALSFPYSKKVPIYSCVDRKSFPVLAWRSSASNSRFTAVFCTITTRPWRLSETLPRRQEKVSLITLGHPRIPPGHSKTPQDTPIYHRTLRGSIIFLFNMLYERVDDILVLIYSLVFVGVLIWLFLLISLDG